MFPSHDKKEEDTIDKDGNVKRWWGCNKELHTLRYPIALEEEISPGTSVKQTRR